MRGIVYADVARELGLVIVGGSIPERCGEKLYNTCCVFNTAGTLLAKHRKVKPLITFPIPLIRRGLEYPNN